jgi:tRNA nucleotidyltransferase (CCA-adding enzyme)
VKVTPDSIPEEVLRVTRGLDEAGFEAYVVGGCIRDLLLGQEPSDWDVTTNATPEDIQAAFPHTFYTNEFGTVGVVWDDALDDRRKVIEVTPYRLEGKYSDSRRPDSVHWSKKLEDDLKRRDFTVNALAYNPEKGVLVDNYNGQKDLAAGLLRAVGAPRDRFAEDALRILRAIRLAAQLDFVIEPATKDAMVAEVDRLAKISKERIRDEFVKMLNSKKPMKAIQLAQAIGALRYIAPDLERGIGVEQNQAHSYDVWEHNLRSLQHAADKGWSFDIRLSALFHDVSKPETRRRSDEKNDWTFYGHDVVGARVTRKALQDLRFPKETIAKVSGLVRWHMFFSDPEKVTLSAVRRIVRNVGEENIWDLVNLRICDRIGTGRPKEQPFRLRKYQSMIEEALRAPLTVGMLKINGTDLMEMGEKPGPRIGYMLHALLEEVLDAPEKNTEEYLHKRVGELAKLPDEELKKRGLAGKERKEEEEKESVQELRRKYHVE